MYAIIETGGKQYRVAEGDQISIEKIKADDGEQVKFDKVLVLGEGTESKVGAPYVDGAAVFGDVIETGKGKKVIIYKYKSKKDYRKKQGHRQPYTMVEITGISADGTAPAKRAAAPVKEDAPAGSADESEKKPALKSMKKAELIEFANENNIEIDDKATKPVILEAIEAALN